MANRNKLVVGNWKMHNNVSESSILVHKLSDKVKNYRNTEVVLCPSFIALQPLSKEIDDKKFKLGAQNAYFIDEGAYTGEVAATQLRDLVDYVIVGHSERRLHFGETDQIVARKTAAVVRNRMTPILCIGENLFDRQDGETDLVVHDQLTAGLVMLTADEVAKMVIAYEPIWAIGTGDIAKPDQIKKALRIIRNTVSELYGAKTAQQVRVLYGGSVKADHVGGYMKLKDLDGFLVGGASLNHEEFSQIITKTHNAKRPRQPQKQSKSR